MRPDHSSISRIPRRCLVISLATGLGLSVSSVHGAPLVRTHAHPVQAADVISELRARAAALTGGHPEHPAGAATHHVTSCMDDGSAGTLRTIVADPMTVSGDIIDFSQLPMMCSKITLGGTAIEINQDVLYLQGPGANLTIDADNASRVFYDTGSKLYISDLTVANGASTGPLPRGGCIYSSDNVSLTDAILTNCTITSTDVFHNAAGGGIFVLGSLTMIRSSISESSALTSVGVGTLGGGAFVFGNLTALASTIRNNSATAFGSIYTYGGGVYVHGDIVDIENSTISGNAANYGGGLYLGGNTFAQILNSTVSGNRALAFGGIVAKSPMTIANSTIAFNASLLFSDAGVYTWNATLTLQNSIIADNLGATPSLDLSGPAATQISGSNNLVVSSNILLPLGTKIECPRLDPLADNGGTTQTHALRHNSPAIDQGDVANFPALDQRGQTRPPGAADIGAFERQPSDQDEIFLANGFDGLCDQ